MHLLCLAIPAVVVTLASPTLAVDFPICQGRHRVTCVVDGDTFWLQGRKIRPEGYDAPEMGGPSCPHRATGAIDARDALARILGSGHIAIEPHGRSFDRTLARVTVDGAELARLMIATGFARTYDPEAKPWC